MNYLSDSWDKVSEMGQEAAKNRVGGDSDRNADGKVFGWGRAA